MTGICSSESDDWTKDGLDRPLIESFGDAIGTLYVKVTEAHEPCHIGDAFHGIRPRVLQAGQVIELGNGQIVWCDD
jgi:hypothetical protein